MELRECFVCGELKNVRRMKAKFLSDYVCGDCLLEHGEDNIQKCSCGNPILINDGDEENGVPTCLCTKCIDDQDYLEYE